MSTPFGRFRKVRLIEIGSRDGGLSNTMHIPGLYTCTFLACQIPQYTCTFLACRTPQYTRTFLACSAATSQLHLKALFLLTDNAAAHTSHLSALKKFVQMSEMVRLRFAMEKLSWSEEAPYSDWMDDTWTGAGDDDCFYYHSWRNNVVIAFGTLSSFLT